MTGIALRADFDGLTRMASALDRLAALDRHQLLDELGATMVSQTQRRMSEEKKSPAGVPWPKWSKRYAKTRHGNQGLLIGKGDLLTSITHNVIAGGRQVEVGSPLIYSRIHQEGGEIKMAARGQYAHMLKDEKTGKNRFVKEGTKGATRRGIDIREHTITMPRREYLGVSSANGLQLEAVCADFLARQTSRAVQ